MKRPFFMPPACAHTISPMDALPRPPSATARRVFLQTFQRAEDGLEGAGWGSTMKMVQREVELQKQRRLIKSATEFELATSSELGLTGNR